MSGLNMLFAQRAPFMKRYAAKDPDGIGLSYAKSNNFTEKWRNFADTADLNGFRFDVLNRFQPRTTLYMDGIVPGSETSGTLMANDLKWTIASGKLISVVVASNVGTFTFAENHNLAVGQSLTVTGATTDTDLNATYTVVAASVSGNTKKLTVTTSSVTNGTYTDAGIVVTSWQGYATAGACGVKLLCANTCNTGEFATMRLRARAENTTASGNGGNSVGTVTCIDASASAQKAEYGNLRAVNAVAQPNALAQTTDATNVVNALYGRIDATAGSVGRRWVEWIDTHATTKADASDFLARYSHNGTIAIDGLFTVYGGGRLPLFLNVEDATPGFIGTSGTAASNFGARIAIKVNGTAMWLNAYTTSNA